MQVQVQPSQGIIRLFKLERMKNQLTLVVKPDQIYDILMKVNCRCLPVIRERLVLDYRALSPEPGARSNPY